MSNKPLKDVEMVGLQELTKALRTIGPAIQGKKGFPKNVLRNASRAMAKKALLNARQRVPVDTGRLRDAIQIKLQSTKYRDRITARGDSAEFFYLGVKRGNSRDDPTGAFYANIVEVGGEYNGRVIPAQPYLRPAILAHQTQLINIFRTKMSRDFKVIVKKLAAA